jgi:hypothetical protein
MRVACEASGQIENRYLVVIGRGWRASLKGCQEGGAWVNIVYEEYWDLVVELCRERQAVVVVSCVCTGHAQHCVCMACVAGRRGKMEGGVPEIGTDFSSKFENRSVSLLWASVAAVYVASGEPSEDVWEPVFRKEASLEFNLDFCSNRLRNWGGVRPPTNCCRNTLYVAERRGGGTR